MLRNLLRRRMRTALTTLGIVVGMLALTVMGAMSEKISLLLDGALRYYGTRVVVQPRGGLPGQLFGTPLDVSTADAIARLPGVAAAFPTVYVLYRESTEETPSATIGFPPLVIGVDARRFTFAGDRYPVVLSAGRHFRPDETGVAVVGVDLARIKHVGLGGQLRVLGRDFRVVGLIERTLTVRDNLAFVPLRDAQELLAGLLPPPFNREPYALASEIEVYPVDLGQADALAAEITQRFAGLQALAPTEVERQFRESLAIFNVIVVGSALVAVLVGGLSIVNTMAMAVTERTREIGVKKAIGASDGDVAREFIGEAAVMGLLGGVVGLAGGSALVWVINRVTMDQGVVIFAVTPRLVALVLVFAVVLGALAGLYPALAASRKDPVQALRAQ